MAKANRKHSTAPRKRAAVRQPTLAEWHAVWRHARVAMDDPTFRSDSVFGYVCDQTEVAICEMVDLKAANHIDLAMKFAVIEGEMASGNGVSGNAEALLESALQDVRRMFPIPEPMVLTEERKQLLDHIGRLMRKRGVGWFVRTMKAHGVRDSADLSDDALRAITGKGSAMAPRQAPGSEQPAIAT